MIALARYLEELKMYVSDHRQLDTEIARVAAWEASEWEASEGYNVEAFVDPTEAFTQFVNVNPFHYNLAILDPNVKIESIFSTPNLNLEAVWNFGGNNNDAAGSLLYCCDVSALFRFFKSRTPHFGHSVDECTRSMDLSVSVRSAFHSEQKYCTSAWP
jgi:hypothetical protein